MSKGSKERAALDAAFEAYRKRAEDLPEKQREIVMAILRRRNPYEGLPYTYDWDVPLQEQFLEGCGENIAAAFSPGGDAYAAVAAMIGTENAACARRMWGRAQLYPYERYVYRRSYRTKRYGALYIAKNTATLLAFIGGIASGFSVDAYVAEHAKGSGVKVFGNEEQYVGQALAAALDDGGVEADALLDRLRQIVNDDAGRATLARPVIAGLLMSGRRDAHELVGSLLLAARLQEGLRQAIMESVDEGSLPGFRYILDLVQEKELTRYSSVVRAFGTWTGLPLEVEKPRRVRELFETACKCLCETDGEAACRSCIAGDDGQKAAVAYWALAFQGIERAEEQVHRTFAEGKKHQKIAALFFAGQIGSATLIFRLIAPLLASRDDIADREIMAWVVQCLSQVADTRIVAEESDRFLHATASAYTLTASIDELARLYLTLKAQLDAFDEKDKKGSTFKDSMPGVDVSYTRGGLLAVMVALLSRFDAEDWQGRWGEDGEEDDDLDEPEEEEANEWGIRLQSDSYWHLKALDPQPDEIDTARPGGLDLRDDLCSYLDKMDADTRAKLIRNVVRSGRTPLQRELLIKSLGDRSNCSMAWQYLRDEAFTDDEIGLVESYLRFKDGTLRQILFLKLLSQEPEKLGGSIRRLVGDKDAMRRAAGEELRSIMARKKDDPNYREIYAGLSASAAPAEAVTDKAKKERAPKEARAEGGRPATGAPDTYNRENGYGLYDPARALRTFDLPVAAVGVDMREAFAIDAERAKALAQRLNDAVHAHRDYRYIGQWYYGSDEKSEIVLGEDEWFVPQTRPPRDPDAYSDEGLTIDNYPLSEVWRDAVREFAESGDGCALFYGATKAVRLADDEDVTAWLPALPGGAELLSAARDVAGFIEELPHRHKVDCLLQALLGEFDRGERFALAERAAAWTIGQREACVTAKKGSGKDKSPQPLRDMKHYPAFVHAWLWDMETAAGDDDEKFAAYFRRMYDFAYGAHGHQDSDYILFSGEGLARAHRLGLLTDGEMTALLFKVGTTGNVFRTMTAPRMRRAFAATAPAFLALLDRTTERIAEIEIERGDMPTEVSVQAGNISRFHGAAHFVRILERSGKDPFERNLYGMIHGENPTRKTMLSALLKACYPAPGEDAATLRSALKGRGVTEQTLIDGAMYAPQWIAPVALLLGWPGLESACWYFHAHVNDTFSAEKETMVARFSEIPPADFNDGAFDVDWFREAHATLGDKRFAAVYAAAKYISVGANHKRSQLFADAVTGKLALADAEREVVEKRTKNYVLCYGLIPLDGKNPGADAMRRYDVLQQFLRESKQFGAQRRESEARAVEIATANLARNAGYPDATRFVWSMEGAKFTALAPYLESREVEGYTLRLEIDGQGRAAMHIAKDGKELKSPPAKLKKNPYVEELKAAAADLKNQHSRARATLERAMEREEPFRPDELRELLGNPIIGPVVGNLVFATTGPERIFGYPAELCETLAARGGEAVVIAHPLAMHAAGVWADYQRDLFDRQAAQPFKQVFRELYLPTEEELSGSESRRYAGHQVQPRRGVALLRTRGWTVRYEEGLQKVHHRENLVAEIYAAADWFSPADVEAPTLESVVFRDRRTGEPAAVKDVPGTIFSEAMRDVDLMVSVAHAGGVDPEASHSTIEMRLAVARETIRLFQLDNVRFEGARAFVKGTRGEYTVHLGSAVVHKMATGAVQVLAVPSQHRGRLFLPFVDDDPRTAEVVSKILLFAEDDKIKDPSILSQL